MPRLPIRRSLRRALARAGLVTLGSAASHALGAQSAAAAFGAPAGTGPAATCSAGVCSAAARPTPAPVAAPKRPGATVAGPRPSRAAATSAAPTWRPTAAGTPRRAPNGPPVAAPITGGTRDRAAWRAAVRPAHAESLAAFRARELAVVARAPQGLALRGDTAAPLLVVEFTDLQCPFCARNELAGARVLDAYVRRGLVQVLTYDLPLPMHPRALEAAMFVHCAAEVTGDYGRARGVTFGAQGLWAQAPDARVAFAALAGSLRADTAKVLVCYDAGPYIDAIAFGFNQARARQITGTPAFDAGGVPLQGARSETDVQAWLESALYGRAEAPKRADPAWKTNFPAIVQKAAGARAP